MLLGDIGETLRLAAEHRLGDARMRLFHPIGFMLASPAADAAEAFEYFEHALVEDKYDGIRAQAHCAGGQVRIFSRTLDEVTPSFPELIGPLGELPGEVILDGEIVAWRHTDDGGHAMPFSEIQKRLGRKQVGQRTDGGSSRGVRCLRRALCRRRADAAEAANGTGGGSGPCLRRAQRESSRGRW